MFKYATKVKIDRSVLEITELSLREEYVNCDPTGDLRKVNKNNGIVTAETKKARSFFSQWNNISKFLERLPKEEFPVLDVVGKSDGGTARIYFQPSVTSLAKPFRKCIVPINEGHQFLFTDIKAAEFAMNAIFAQETEAVEAYQRGEDIYMHYAYLFPEGTSRAIIKKILIANMYNQTAYRVALDLGISETQAQRLLDMIAARIPRMTMLKRRICAYCMKHKGYFAPNGFDQTNLIKVADIDPAKGFNADYALSCYTQSALGFFMQDLTKKLESKVRGTLLSVFDSVLIEHDPENAERLEGWLKRHLAPFVPDEFTYGKTFWDAAYGND